MSKLISQWVVYSTLAADMKYTNHKAGGGDIPIPDAEVFVKGGAGVANDRLITPMGVATVVTEEQLAFLRENRIFQMHEGAGYIIVSEEKVDPEKMASNMNSQDPSRPLNETELTRGPSGSPSTPAADGEGELTLTTNGKKK